MEFWCYLEFSAFTIEEVLFEPEMRDMNLELFERLIFKFEGARLEWVVFCAEGWSKSVSLGSRGPRRFWGAWSLRLKLLAAFDFDFEFDDFEHGTDRATASATATAVLASVGCCSALSISLSARQIKRDNS
eukprot:CAMPEP_0116989216 /NCGR_PEP_ID=MMETSP0467-20121206/64674_1 /TAXON_ID=283647 /ORGANISM="Mesodinium pulex, Strain SPMC105" /LENGTH=130 /DNA_ID=CAMNT_0004685593 /DNA_START=1254 /DNA_END=1644 /DNA_ORIENTATION=+